MEKGLNSFISAAAEREHREHLATLKHKASIWKKSGFDIGNMTERDIAATRLSREEKRELSELKRDISMHELYFSSFSGSYMPCSAIKERFGSENNFAYELSRFAERLEGDFAVICTDRAGRIFFCEDGRIPTGARPLLAIDMAEHAYFRDYGFKKDKYLRAAIAHLDLSKISRPADGRNEAKK